MNAKQRPTERRREPEESAGSKTGSQTIEPPAGRLIEIPLAPYDGKSQLAMHVDLSLQDCHRIPLRRLRVGLESIQATLAAGRRVETNADAIRWLLEHLAEWAGERSGCNDAI